MKIKPYIANSVGAAFGISIIASAYDGHHDGQLHLPPGNAPLTLSTAASTSHATMVQSYVVHSAIHDAEYVLPANTKPLKSDGQTEKA